MTNQKPPIISEKTLVPLSLIGILILGVVRVERIGWISDSVMIQAQANTSDLKAQAKEIDEIKDQFLKAVQEINLTLAEIKGAKNGSKETKNN